MRNFNGLFATLFIAAGICLGTGVSADGAIIEVRLADADRANDYEAVSDGTNPSQGTGNDLRIGTTVASATTPRIASAIFAFPLPVIPPGETISSATLTVLVVGQATTNQPRATQNADLYGLPFDDEPSLDITNARNFSGANDATAGVVKLQDNFLTPTTPGVTSTSTTEYTSLTSIDISSYLISLYNGGADDGDFAVFRMSDDNPDGTVLQRYRIRSAGGSSTANPEAEKPVLTITTIPEPATVGLLAAGSLGLLARRHRRRN